VRCSWARDLFSAIDGAKTLGNRILAALERMTVRRADKAYAPSEFLADYMSRTHGLPFGCGSASLLLESQPAKYVPAAVRENCRHAIWIHEGRLVRDGDSASVTELYHGWSLGDRVALPQALCLEGR
jgi:hypothetical protein